MNNTSNNTLSAFDFSRNVNLVEAQVVDLVGGDFVRRGENLVLSGNRGTGKSHIANAIHDSVIRQGMSSRKLTDPNPMFAGWELTTPGMFNPAQPAPSAISSALLDIDLLIVENADHWLTACPMHFIFLLGRRLELGRSNLLIMSSVDEECNTRLTRNHPARVGNNLDVLKIVDDTESMWARYQAFQRIESLSAVFDAFGMDTTSAAYRQCTGLPPVVNALPAPALFNGNKPVWHLTYTGQDDYRKMVD